MRVHRTAMAIAGVIVFAAAGALIARSQLPGIGAGALLYPTRHGPRRAAPAGCVERAFDGVRVTLAGWVCSAQAAPGTPTVVYLHGISDNRDSAIGVIDRFLRRGFDVIAYDSRGHGRSGGDTCTYGFFEKEDLKLVLDQAGIDRAIVIGHSLGAAVALQAASIDPRIDAVVSAATFADLRSIATERAPFVFSLSAIAAAFVRAEHDGRFVADQVSPVRAAAALTIPVLMIHGDQDRNTRPAHSDRVFAALRGPKQLLKVRGAGHNDVFRNEVWSEIERWIDALP